MSLLYFLLIVHAILLIVPFFLHFRQIKGKKITKIISVMLSVLQMIIIMCILIKYRKIDIKITYLVIIYIFQIPLIWAKVKSKNKLEYVFNIVSVTFAAICLIINAYVSHKGLNSELIPDTKPDTISYIPYTIKAEYNLKRDPNEQKAEYGHSQFQEYSATVNDILNKYNSVNDSSIQKLRVYSETYGTYKEVDGDDTLFQVYEKYKQNTPLRFFYLPQMKITMNKFKTIKLKEGTEIFNTNRDMKINDFISDFNENHKTDIKNLFLDEKNQDELVNNDETFMEVLSKTNDTQLNFLYLVPMKVKVKIENEDTILPGKNKFFKVIYVSELFNKINECTGLKPEQYFLTYEVDDVDDDDDGDDDDDDDNLKTLRSRFKGPLHSYDVDNKQTLTLVKDKHKIN